MKKVVLTNSELGVVKYALDFTMECLKGAIDKCTDDVEIQALKLSLLDVDKAYKNISSQTK